jgi:hypothetical protein
MKREHKGQRSLYEEYLELDEVGPNSVRPWGERRSPLRSAKSACHSSRRGGSLVTALKGFPRRPGVRPAAWGFLPECKPPRGGFERHDPSKDRSC